MTGDGSAWVKAELLARRVYQLATLPMRSENHPTWAPAWRAAIHNALSAIGSATSPPWNEPSRRSTD